MEGEGDTVGDPIDRGEEDTGEEGELGTAGGATGGGEDETEEESLEGGTGKRKDRGTEGEGDTVEDGEA